MLCQINQTDGDSVSKKTKARTGITVRRLKYSFPSENIIGKICFCRQERINLRMMTTPERFTSYLRDELRYSPNTVEAYRRDIEAWSSFYGTEKPLEDASPADVRHFIAERARKGYAISSLRRTTVAIRSLYNFMMRNDGLKANPAGRLNPGRLPRRLPVNVKPSETASMLDDMEEQASGFTGLRDRLMLEMLYETGMRCSELITLRDDRVDTSRGELRITGKGNKERVIPFGQGLSELISDYRLARTAGDGPGAAGPGDNFFVRADGRPLYRKLVYNVVHSAMAQAGVHATRLSPHVMRHSFATDMLSGGASLNSVQKLLGHSSLATTQIYTHISLEELRKNYASAHPHAHHHNHNNP